jgi:hypothetical protein
MKNDKTDLSLHQRNFGKTKLFFGIEKYECRVVAFFA